MDCERALASGIGAAHGLRKRVYTISKKAGARRITPTTIVAPSGMKILRRKVRICLTLNSDIFTYCHTLGRDRNSAMALDLIYFSGGARERVLQAILGAGHRVTSIFINDP